MTHTVQSYADMLRASVAERRTYEQAKNASCDSMLDALKTFDKRLAQDSVVALCATANLNANILNRAERNNARFNIYSFAKILSDVSRASMNHYTLAILKSAVALRTAKLTLTHADAVAACSLTVKHRDVSRAKIIAASRYAKHVAVNTASTQSSSSINSLQALNVLAESKDDANHVCYTLCDNDFANALIASVQ